MADTLDNPFDDTVTCEDVGVNKPDAQVFAYCRGRQSVHGIGLNETMHVAQSQYHDIGISMRLGYKTCWIERRKGKDGFGATPNPDTITQPDLNFDTLSAFSDHMDLQLGH
jgi:putative hydrolase of the HAD superfamily